MKEKKSFHQHLYDIGRKKRDEYYDSFKNKVDYVQVYDNAIPKKDCDYLIKQHNRLKTEGFCDKGKVMSKELNVSKKDLWLKNSHDIFLNKYIDVFSRTKKYSYLHKKVTNLFETLSAFVSDYIIKIGLGGHSFIGTGLYQYQNYFKENKMDIPDYLNDIIGIGSVNLRKYDKNIGGYHSMHCDWGQNNLQRLCAVILYLNTVEEGGETIFPVIGRKIKPVVGRILIFPSFYTHMHYGEIATSSDRYIVASHVHYSNREIIKK